MKLLLARVGRNKRSALRRISDRVVPALRLLGQSKNAIAALELRRHLGVCRRSAWRIKRPSVHAMTLSEAEPAIGGRGADQ